MLPEDVSGGAVEEGEGRDRVVWLEEVEDWFFLRGRGFLILTRQRGEGGKWCVIRGRGGG